ncbi:MAG: helix-turn-helix domain-containing protein [Chthoniobacterales bacterium]
MKTRISFEGLPLIDRAGLFPLLNPVFDFSYRNPTNALHLYDYHGWVRVNSREIALSPGDVTCIPAGSVYGFQSDRPGNHWCIHFHDTPGPGDEAAEVPLLTHGGGSAPFHREQIQIIVRLCSGPGAGAGLGGHWLEARFRLKALLLSLRGSDRSRSIRRVVAPSFDWNELITWLDANLAQPISMQEAAQKANVATGTLAKKFRENYRTTLSNYLLHRRVEKAKALLSSTTFTIFEVGASVGIPDAQYFNKQFRKVTGVSPSAFRLESRDFLTRMDEELAVKEGRWTGPGEGQVTP